MLAQLGIEVKGLVAPAIGTYDFLKVSTEKRLLGGVPAKFKATDIQPLNNATIVLGPNKFDSVLKKFIGVPGRFGSTWVGSKPYEAQELANVFSQSGEKVSMVNFSASENGSSHSFSGYMESTPFKQLVKAYFSTSNR